jgi:predicted permease
MALCLGANIAVFSAVYGVLLKPLDLPQPERLYYVYNTQPGIGLNVSSISFRDYLDRREAEGLLDASLYHQVNVALTEGESALSLRAVRTTSTFFRTVGVPPLQGAPWDPANEDLSRPDQVVISHRVWKEMLEGRENIVGSPISLDRETYTVVGVMPEGFRFPWDTTDIWLPAIVTPEMRTDEERGSEYWTGIARLKPGVSPETVRAQFDAIQAGIAERLPEQGAWWESAGFGPVLRNMVEHHTEDVRVLLYMVQGVALCVLLLGVCNILGLYLTQTLGRAHELTVRVSVGANLRQIGTQLVIEVLALLSIGSILGFFAADGLIQTLEHLGFDSLPRSQNIEMSVPVILFGVGLVILLGLGIGLSQTLYAWRTGLSSQLRDSGTRTAGSRGKARVRKVLVTIELVLAMILLSGAALLTQSFRSLQKVDPGYNPEGIVYGRLTVPASIYPENSDQQSFVDRLLAETRTIPGVKAAGIAQVLPFSGSNWGMSYDIEGYEPADPNQDLHCNFRVVSDGYFEAMEMRLVEGRWFRPEDGRTDGVRVAIVSRLWLETYGLEGTALGRRINVHGFRNADGEPAYREIIGVVEDVRFSRLDTPTSKEMIYLPYNDATVPYVNVVARADPSLDPAALLEPLREALLRVDPQLPFARTGLLNSYLEDHLASRQAAMSLVILSGSLALILAVTGLYGVIAFSVRQRQTEIGIRMALGASPDAIFRQIGKEGLKLVATGLALGVVSAIGAGYAVRSLLFGISPLDPASLLGATAALALAAALALFLPARRAMRIDPAVALRDE